MCSLLGLASSASAADELEFFETRIRPLLAERCFECHGPEKQKSNLRLDHIRFIRKGGERGPALNEHAPAASRILEAIGYTNVDLQMPPKGKLSDAQIADLMRWIEMGAPWPDEAVPQHDDLPSSDEFDIAALKAEHWAWRPVKRPAPPEVNNPRWPRDPIDRFILAKLEAFRLAPAPPAGRRTWIRRVYFDLIGLPPTVEQVNAFVADDAPQAFERVVNDLLASPRFGERWGRHWLDLVRYAETHGHEFDYPVENAWRYRDYVITALNDDVPYDQFVREHVAGDLLPRPRRNDDGANQSIRGTGFWFMHEALHAPVDVRQDQADHIDNMIDVYGKAFLGLTIACARCHDHKFDAISTADYYALSGVLQSTRKSQAMLDPTGRIANLADRMRQLNQRAGEQLEAMLPPEEAAAQQPFAAYLTAAHESSSPSQELDPAEVARWVEALKDPALTDPLHPLHAWSIASQEAVEKTDTKRGKLPVVSEESADVAAKLAASRPLLDFNDGTLDGWHLIGAAFGAAPTRPGDWTIADGVPRTTFEGGLHSGGISHKLQGIARSKTFILDGDTLLYRISGRDAQVRLIIDGYTMDVFSPLLFEGLSFHLESGERWIWHAVDVSRYRGHRAHLELIDEGDGYVALDEVRVLESAAATGNLEPPPQRSAADAARAWHERDPRLVNWGIEHELLGLGTLKQKARTFRDELAALEAELPQPLRVLAAADGSGIDERIFIRGSHRSLGDVVPRRFLEALSDGDESPMPANGSGRLELAERMLTDGRHFVSRVAVNRVWHHLFGQGIVATVDNFGVLGEAPSHPELLDYLADTFVHDDGWSMKKLIRRIVLSQTYRMTPGSAPALGNASGGEQIDPQNLLLHRMNVKRLEGEAIRDAVLAVSGRLDLTMGGPGVAVHLTPFMEGRGRPGKSGPLDGDGRRSIYLEVRRNFLNPMMLAFDTPTPFSAVGRRSVSNVPAQALILMNDPLIVQQAGEWAKRSFKDAKVTPPQRIDVLYQQAFARHATETEIAAAMQFLQQQAASYGLGTAAINTNEQIWSDLCHVLFNVKEFIFIR